MLKCCDCGLIFREEDAHSYTENVGECHGEKIFETYIDCPHCGGSVEEANPCPICGEYDDIDNGETYCNHCKKKVQRKLNDLIKDNFDENEIQYLIDEFDIEI